MSGRTLTGTLASDVADAGTFAVSYPTGTDEGAFYGAFGHHIVVNGSKYDFPDDLGLTFTTTTITVTNKSGASWPAGAEWYLNLNQHGKGGELAFDSGNSASSVVRPKRTQKIGDGLYLINLGAPDAIVTDGVCEAQSPSEAGALDLDGALVSGGVATFDVPRNLVADSGGADDAILTITGTDEYGSTLVETITLNGTTAVAGKKAFKTVTSVTCSKAIANGAFLGTGDVLGLPVRLDEKGFVLKELEDGANATAGTLVAGINTAGGSTATTGDVRGTYDPNSAADGDKVFQLIVALPSLDRGIAQYAG